MDFYEFATTLLTFYLSFKYYFIESVIDAVTFKAGNLYTNAFGCVICIFLIAAACN